MLRGLSSYEICCGLVKRIITLFLVPKDDTWEIFIEHSELDWIAWCSTCWSIMGARVCRDFHRQFNPSPFSIFVLYVGCHDRLCRWWSSVQFGVFFCFFYCQLFMFYQCEKGSFLKYVLVKDWCSNPFCQEDRLHREDDSLGYEKHKMKQSADTRQKVAFVSLKLFWLKVFFFF